MYSFSVAACAVAIMAGHMQHSPPSELMNNTQQDLDDFRTGLPPPMKRK